MFSWGHFRTFLLSPVCNLASLEPKYFWTYYSIHPIPFIIHKSAIYVDIFPEIYSFLCIFSTMVEIFKVVENYLNNYLNKLRRPKFSSLLNYKIILFKTGIVEK